MCVFFFRIQTHFVYLYHPAVKINTIAFTVLKWVKIHFNLILSFVDMCGVEGKRRLCDLNVTSSSPALATRHLPDVLFVNSQIN